MQKNNMSFLENLGFILEQYLKRYKLSFYLHNKKIPDNKVFSIYGYLPLFIYDKKIYFQEILQAINQTEKTCYHATLVFFPELNSELGITYSLLHNLNNSRTTKNNVYLKTLLHVAKNILHSKSLYFENNKIILDSTCKDMINHLKNERGYWHILNELKKLEFPYNDIEGIKELNISNNSFNINDKIKNNKKDNQ